jgi:hypothetical protein
MGYGFSNRLLIRTNPIKKNASEWVFIHFFLDIVSGADILRSKEGTLTPIGTTGSGTEKVSSLTCPDLTRLKRENDGGLPFSFSPRTVITPRPRKSEKKNTDTRHIGPGSYA